MDCDDDVMYILPLIWVLNMIDSVDALMIEYDDKFG